MPADSDHPDEPLFVLGGHSSDELTTEELEQRRRTRRFALWGLAAAAVVVALSITLVAVLVDTSSHQTSPAAAAQQWARDLVRGDSAGRVALECAGGARGTDTLHLVLTSAAGARAGQARRVGRTSWRVPLDFVGPDGLTEASYTVDVIRRAGRYLVC